MTLFGTVTNLSQGGVFLRTLPIINIGSDVELKLSIDHGVVIAKGEVRWRSKPVSSGANPDQEPPGLGIMLTSFDGGRDLLERHIERVSLIPEPPYEDDY